MRAEPRVKASLSIKSKIFSQYKIVCVCSPAHLGVAAHRDGGGRHLLGRAHHATVPPRRAALASRVADTGVG